MLNPVYLVISLTFGGATNFETVFTLYTDCYDFLFFNIF